VSATLTQFCPAKINPFLAVTGRREDGFHELVSVVTTVRCGDMLRATPAGAGEYSLTCSDSALPTDESNLVLKATREFTHETGWDGGVHFELEKRLPSGAGLGGGSSDAVGALKALNALSGHQLDAAGLHRVAARVGSDCPLFLPGRPLVMRGRGEQIEVFSPATAERIQNQRVLLLKPPFGINTAWAYQTLAAKAPGSYRDAEQAEDQLSTWCDNESATLDDLGFNSFMPAVGAKWLAIKALADCLRQEEGVTLHLSGSGSACFVWLASGLEVQPIVELARRCWGEGTWWTETDCGLPRETNPN